MLPYLVRGGSHSLWKRMNVTEEREARSKSAQDPYAQVNGIQPPSLLRFPSHSRCANAPSRRAFVAGVGASHAFGGREHYPSIVSISSMLLQVEPELKIHRELHPTSFLIAEPTLVVSVVRVR